MRLRRVAAVLLVLTLACVGVARAANCALRSPDRQIYDLFPNATNYRTIEASVDQKMIQVLEKILGSPIALSDMGKHAIYVALEDDVPVGLVHARSEVGKSGSVELIWAMDLDLTILDFRVQRSREKETKTIKSDSFRARMIGNDLQDFRRYLIDDNSAVDVAALGIPVKAGKIAHTAVLCGLKTRIITQAAFGDAILPLRLIGNAYRHFPGTEKVTKVSSPLSPEVLAKLESATPKVSLDQVDQDSFVIVRSVDGSGATQGFIANSLWSAHRASPELWMAVSVGGTIIEYDVIGDLAPGTTESFAKLKGRNLQDLKNSPDLSSSLPIKCAIEMLAILGANGVGE